MAEIEWTKPVYIVACDLIAYTDTTPFAQSAAKAKIDRWQATAVPRGAKHLGWADAGDGGYLVLDGPPDCAAEALRRFCASNEAEDQFEFRYCLHHGIVTKQTGEGGQLFSGDGINEAARLLNGMAKDKVGLVVCSGAYARILEREVEPSRYELTRLPDIAGKRDESFEAWSFRVAGGPGAAAVATSFISADFVELWLRKRPIEVIITFAARAALRTAPFMAMSGDRVDGGHAHALVSTGFCAVLVPFVAGKWPNHVTRVVRFASAFAAVAQTYIPIDARAAHAHAAAAARTHASAVHSGYAPNDARAAYTHAIAAHADAKAAVKADIDRTENGGAAALADSPIWPSSHFLFAEEWADLKRWLLDQGDHWSVWTDWYDARLANEPADPELELARILCLDGADLTNAEDVNRRIQAAVDAHQPKAEVATPIPRPPEIDKSSADIARRHQVERPERKTGAQLHRQLKTRLLRAVDRLSSGANNAEFHELHEGLAQFRDVIEVSYDADLWAEDWTDEFDNIRREISIKRDGGYLAKTSSELSQFTEALEKASFEIGEVYPHIEEMEQALRARRFRSLTEDELEAVEASLKAFADIVDEGLKQDLDEDVEGIRADIEAIKARGDDPLRTLPGGARKARLYRLKALYLRTRRLAKTSPEELERILDNGVDWSKKIEAYRQAAATLDELWVTLRHWFTGGS